MVQRRRAVCVLAEQREASPQQLSHARARTDHHSKREGRPPLRVPRRQAGRRGGIRKQATAGMRNGRNGRRFVVGVAFEGDAQKHSELCGLVVTDGLVQEGAVSNLEGGISLEIGSEGWHAVRVDIARPIVAK